MIPIPPTGDAPVSEDVEERGSGVRESDGAMIARLIHLRMHVVGHGDALILLDGDLARLRALASRIETMERDAERWRGLMRCERVRVLGGAQIGTPDELLGVEFYATFPEVDDAKARAEFTAFADRRAARASSQQDAEEGR